jgi:glycosyltransferase involved in cell wall biosynthesis
VKLIKPSFIKIPVLSRISAFVTHYLAIKKILKEKKIDVIILYSVPTNGLQTIHLAKKFGVPVLFRSIDTLNQLVPKILSKPTLIMEREVYAKADLVATISCRLSNYVIQNKADESRVRLLPLGIDLIDYRPDMNGNGLREQWGLNGSKVIVFIGTLPKFSGLDNFIQEFPKILKEVPDTKLMIVGDGVQRTQLEKLVTELGLRYNVIFTGYQPYDKMAQYINLADVCINPFKICKATKDIFPTKVIQYMACGKPVVSSWMPGLKDMVYQGVYFAKSNEIRTQMLINLLKSKAMMEQVGNLALQYVNEHHCYKNIVKQMEVMLEGLKKK